MDPRVRKVHFLMAGIVFFLNRNLRQKLQILNVFQKIRFSTSKNLRIFLKNESKLKGLTFSKPRLAQASH